MEPRRVKVGDAVYQLRRWSYQDGRLWLYRLMGLIAKGAGGASLAISDEAAAAEVLEAIGESRYLEFCDLLESYVDLVQVMDGRERIIALDEVKAVHMQGRYLDLVVLMKETVEHEFGPFFSGIKALLGDASKKDPSAETDT